MNNKQQHKIILVDDHILLRDALANLINAFPEFKVIGVAANGQEMINIIKEGTTPHLVIMDLNMPVMDGYESTLWLQMNEPQAKILILTMFDSEIALIRLLKI